MENVEEEAILKITNILGQQVDLIAIEGDAGSLEINNLTSKGIYFLQIEVDGRMSKVQKVVKQ